MNARITDMYGQLYFNPVTLGPVEISETKCR